MLYWQKPAQAAIADWLALQQNSSFSYRDIGCTQNGAMGAPMGYIADHNHSQLGTGQETFVRAKEAICNWQMFNLGWTKLCWPHAPIAVDSTVGMLARGMGCWWLNACRIVYTIDEVKDEMNGDCERFGFAYGTLPAHLERGEERFMVEWRRADDTVWYDILAFSQPNHVLAKVGYPIVRQYQKRFARDSKQAMKEAVQ